ncbi:MAG: recombinase family protein, partial [Phyllobacterium sp.]
MVALERRKKELKAFLDNEEEPPPLLHPNLTKYHEEIAGLHDRLGNEETRAQAADKLRMLVSRIELVPNG